MPPRLSMTASLRSSARPSRLGSADLAPIFEKSRVRLRRPRISHCNTAASGQMAGAGAAPVASRTGLSQHLAGLAAGGAALRSAGCRLAATACASRPPKDDITLSQNRHPLPGSPLLFSLSPSRIPPSSLTTNATQPPLLNPSPHTNLATMSSGGKSGGKAGDASTKAQSRSAKAGLQFPVGRIHRLLRKGRTGKHQQGDGGEGGNVFHKVKPLFERAIDPF